MRSGSHSRSSYEQQHETVPIDAFDLTDADSAYDYEGYLYQQALIQQQQQLRLQERHQQLQDQQQQSAQIYNQIYDTRHSQSVPSPSEASTSSTHFYMDLTRHGQYDLAHAVGGSATTTGTTIDLRSSAVSSAQMTPRPAGNETYNINNRTVSPYQRRQPQQQRQYELRSLTPPSPIQRFQQVHPDVSLAISYTPISYGQSSDVTDLRSPIHTPMNSASHSTDFRSPTPPTPIQPFRVFDLTCFIEDYDAASVGASLMDRVEEEEEEEEEVEEHEDPAYDTEQMTVGGEETRLLYEVAASPSHDYQDVVTSSYCHHGGSSPAIPTTAYNAPRMTRPSADAYWNVNVTDGGMMRATLMHDATMDTLEEPAYLEQPLAATAAPVTTPCYPDDHLSEASTIEDHMSANANSILKEQHRHAHFEDDDDEEEDEEEYEEYEVDEEEEVDFFGADCIRNAHHNVVDTCDDRVFDRLCRGKQPADTATVTPSITTENDKDNHKERHGKHHSSDTYPSGKKVDRDEIRSCGTLPPDGPVIFDDELAKIEAEEKITKTPIRKKTENIKSNREGKYAAWKEARALSEDKRSPVEQRTSRGKEWSLYHEVRNQRSNAGAFERIRQSERLYKKEKERKPDKLVIKEAEHDDGSDDYFSYDYDTRSGTNESMGQLTMGNQTLSVAYTTDDKGEDFMVYYETLYGSSPASTDSGDMDTSNKDILGQSAATSYDESNETGDSFGTTVVDRREWMGSFLVDLFKDRDQCKSLYYATNMAMKQQNLENQRAASKSGASCENGKQEMGTTGKNERVSALVDFTELKDFCNFVMSHLDLSEVVRNIDGTFFLFLFDGLFVFVWVLSQHVGLFMPCRHRGSI